jgi:hypothetical protein
MRSTRKCTRSMWLIFIYKQTQHRLRADRFAQKREQSGGVTLEWYP